MLVQLEEPRTAEVPGVTATPSTPQGRSIVPTAAFVGAACSIASGAVHLGASQTHLEHLTLSRLFLAEAAAQLLVGAALLVTASRRVRFAALAVNTGSVLAWLATRMVGITWIDGLDVREAPQVSDTICAVLAAAAVVALAASFATKRTGAGSGRVSPPIVALTVVMATVLGVVGVARLGSHEHHHDEGVAAGATERGAPWRIGATDAELADTERLVEQTQAVVATFTSVADAESKGFVRINDDHLLNTARVFDDKQLDPTAIEALVVGQRDGQDYIRGGMYLMDVNQTMRDVPRFGGPLMVWHSHGGFCFEPSGVIKAGPEAGGTCPAGSVWLDDPPMVHIYTEAQSDNSKLRTQNACGTFTVMDLPFDRPVPGCGTSDGHAGHAHS